MTVEDKAIREDVLESSQEDVAVESAEEPQQNDERTDAIEALANQREAEILAESGEQTEEDETAEEPIDESEATEEPKEQLVKVKIDGEEVELPISEVLKGYQKDATASKRLEQAANERQELDQLRAEYDAKQIEKEEPVQESNLSNDDELERANKITSALDDLNVGSDEERLAATKALEELFGGRGNTATQEDIDLKISQATQQEVQSRLNTQQYEAAQSGFIDDNQDIVSATSDDPFRVNVFNEILREKLNTAETHEQAFKDAGSEFRKWNGMSSSVSKQELKEQLQSEPAKVGSRASAAPKPKAETPSDIIAAMAKSRGQ